MTKQLDILEDFCRMLGHQYRRIDGQTAAEDREKRIEEFNADGSEIFCFLLSTRSGGLGINLATADIVVIFDSDWNPQMDLQAQDRAHRIGQKKPVFVYRFITEGSIEEKVLERAELKLRLDAMVIQQGKAMTATQQQKLSKDEMLAMIRCGADQIFKGTFSLDSLNNVNAAMSVLGADVTLDMDAITRAAEEHQRQHLGLTGPSVEGGRRRAALQAAQATARQSRSLGLSLGEQRATGKQMRRMLLEGKPRPLPVMNDWQFWDSARLRQLHEREVEFYAELQAWLNKHGAQADILLAEEGTSCLSLKCPSYVHVVRTVLYALCVLCVRADRSAGQGATQAAQTARGRVVRATADGRFRQVQSARPPALRATVRAVRQAPRRRGGQEDGA
ncbi:MAG: hypothetical protein MHM6MM_008933, partial [Cercozoa sp. M6MM]